MHRVRLHLVSCFVVFGLVGCSMGAPAAQPAPTTAPGGATQSSEVESSPGADAPPTVAAASEATALPPTALPERPAAPTIAPFRIDAEVDADKAASAVVPLEGGVIETTGADGTSYRLEIPPAALETTTTITMTPIVRFNGMPVGDRTLGVHLAPDGLQAYRLLTLTIRPQGEYPLQQAYYFSFDDADGRLQPTPSPVRRTALEIPVLHFSSHASTVLTTQESEAVVASSQSDPTTAMKAGLARILHDARTGPADITDEHLARINELFAEYYRDALIPAIEAGIQEGGAAAERAIRMILDLAHLEELTGEGPGALRLLEQTGNALYDAMMRTAMEGIGGVSCGELETLRRLIMQNGRIRELLGLMDEPTFFEWDHVRRFAVASLLTCVLEEYERCLNDHIIHRIPYAWSHYVTRLDTFGYEGPIAFNGSAIERLPARDPLRIGYMMVKSCMTVRLDFESFGRFEKEGGGYESEVEAKNAMPPILDPVVDPWWKGITELTSKRFDSFGPSPCVWSGVPGGGAFETYKLNMELDGRPIEWSTLQLKDYRLIYFPGKTSESITVDCPEAPAYTMPPEPLWTGVFNVLHQDEGVPPTVVDWELLTGSEVLARKEWNLSDGGLGLKERGKLEIVHTPATLSIDQLRNAARTAAEKAVNELRRNITPRRAR